MNDTRVRHFNFRIELAPDISRDDTINATRAIADWLENHLTDGIELAGTFPLISKNQLAKFCGAILICAGWSFDEVAKAVGKENRKGWVERLNKELVGADNKIQLTVVFGDKRISNGRVQTHTSPEIVEFVAGLIKTSPFEKWTGPRIAALISCKFNIKDVHPQRGLEVLTLAKNIIRRNAA